MEAQANKSVDRRIQRALDILHGAANRQFAVIELAQAVDLSTSYFQHLFRRETGVSPAKYLQDLKLRSVAHLLKTTSLPVKEVFHVVGVSDPSHFIRKFRRAYGVAPSLYRGQDQNHPGKAQPARSLQATRTRHEAGFA